MIQAQSAREPSRAYRDVFDRVGAPSLREFYERGVFLWKRLYQGDEPWREIASPTVADPRARRELFRMNTARSVSEEIASLVWGEGCKITASFARDGGELNDFLQDALQRSDFYRAMQSVLGKCLALGGGAARVWIEDGFVRVGVCAADQFVPVSWDGQRVTDAVFLSRAGCGGRALTLLAWHTREKDACHVVNELYQGDGGGALGRRIPLNTACPHLAERTSLPMENGLFHAFLLPGPGGWDGGPLGEGVFARALDTLKALDICFDSLVREFRLGRKRLIVPARCVRAVPDPVTGEMRRFFDASDEAYEALSCDDMDGMNVTDSSPELRVGEHVSALGALLNILCLQVGVSPGTFTFDRAAGLKTATEVVSENSKTFKTVRMIQNQLAPALEGMARSVVEAACLCGARWRGEKVASLARGGCHVSVAFDDGITQDRRSNLQEGIQLIREGLMSKYTFLTDARYGQGMTPEAAEEELRRVAREGRADSGKENTDV